MHGFRHICHRRPHLLRHLQVQARGREGARWGRGIDFIQKVGSRGALYSAKDGKGGAPAYLVLREVRVRLEGGEHVLVLGVQSGDGCLAAPHLLALPGARGHGVR